MSNMVCKSLEGCIEFHGNHSSSKVLQLHRHNARRSRVRKLQYIAELERNAQALQVLPLTFLLLLEQLQLFNMFCINHYSYCYMSLLLHTCMVAWTCQTARSVVWIRLDRFRLAESGRILASHEWDKYSIWSNMKFIGGLAKNKYNNFTWARSHTLYIC